MWKYPSDLSVSKKKCIDANLEIFERRDPDNFPLFPMQEWDAWTIPEIALKIRKCNGYTSKNEMK